MSDCKQHCNDDKRDHKDHGMAHDIAGIYEAHHRPEDTQQRQHLGMKDDKNEGCGGQKCDDKKECGLNKKPSQ